MCDAALLDLVHTCPTCARSALRDEPAGNARIFLLCGKRPPPDRSSFSGARAHVLAGGSTAECLYRFKQLVDANELSSVRVITTPRGRLTLLQYQELLFTAVYSFRYHLVGGGAAACPDCACSATSDSPVRAVGEEVEALVRQLPPLKGNILVLQSPLIPGCFGHGFSTRCGGVSSGSPSLCSLNLASSRKRQDPDVLVAENWRRLALHAGFSSLPLHLPKVAHGAAVWVLGREQPDSYDAVVTDRRGVVLAAPGADCMTLLFADPRSKVIAAAHAGWRGTLGGVATATLDAMVSEFGCEAAEVMVAVGPSVGPCCFTLQPAEALQFLRIHPDCVPDPESPAPHVDLRLANRILLERGGVRPAHIHDHMVAPQQQQQQPLLTSCSSCDSAHFFSHNRDGAHFGTQVGFLWIREGGGS